jgi:acyltransferase
VRGRTDPAYAARMRQGAGGKVRLASIDVVRIVALVAIVQGHAMAHSELTDRLVQSWRLPVFFMLSGYFWSVARDMRTEVDRRTRSLLVPYVVWLVVICGVAVVTRIGFDPGDVVSFGGRAVLGGSYAHAPLTTFWFFTALFAAVVAYRWLSARPTWLRLAVVGTGLAANVVAGEAIARVPWSLGTATGALAFLEAGRAVRRAADRYPPSGRAGIAVGAFALAVVPLVVVGDFEPLDMKSGQFPLLAVVVALAAGAALVLAATSWTRMPPRFAATVTALARPSLVVIVLHPLLLWLMPRETVPDLLRFAVALVVPWVLGLVVVRTPLSWWLAGVPQERPTASLAAGPQAAPVAPSAGAPASSPPAPRPELVDSLEGPGQDATASPAPEREG